MAYFMRSFRNFALCLSIFLTLACTPSQSRKRVMVNFEHDEIEESSPAPPPAVEPGEKNMEDILDEPHFRYRKTDLGEDPNVWGDALSAYDTMLRFRENRQVDPNGDPIGMYKTGLFVPFMEMSDSFPAKRELPEKSLEDRHEDLLGKSEKDDGSERVRQGVEGTLSTLLDLTSRPPLSCPTHERVLSEAPNVTSLIPDADRLLLENRFLEMNSGSVLRETVYGHCGEKTSKGMACFGVVDSDCVEKNSCRMLVSMKNSSDRNPADRVLVTLLLSDAGMPEDAYVGLAFSKDRHIGQDLLIYCINATIEKEKKVALFFSYIDDDQRSNMQVSKQAYIRNVCLKSARLQPGILMCSFELSAVLTYDNGSKYDIMTSPFYQMLTFGHYKRTLLHNDTAFGGIHRSQLAAFSRKLVVVNDAISNSEIIKAESRVLVILHVMFAAATYVFLLPFGMIIAKYGREIYGYKRKTAGCYVMPVWLLIHIRMNILGLVFALLSLLFILIDLDFTWRSVSFWPRMHSIVGLISMLLLPVSFGVGWSFNLENSHSSVDVPKFITKFMAWFHWAIGNLTYLTGIFCVGIARHLTRALAPCFVEYFGYLQLLVHILIHLFMAYDSFRLVKKIDGRYMFQRAVLGPMIPWSKGEISKQTKQDFHDADVWKMRRRIVTFYFIANFLCAFAICTLMLLPVVLCRE